MKELTTQEAFNKAAACCSGAEYCLSDIQKKLDKWGTRGCATKEVLTQPPSGKIHRLKARIQAGDFGTGQISDITNGGALNHASPSDLKTFPTRVAGRH